jgi:hypothetical protein
LTPWSLASPRVHVLLRGLRGGKVRPLWSSSPLHWGQKTVFFSFTDGVRLSLNPHPSSVADGVGGQNPPSVIRSGWYRKMT